MFSYMFYVFRIEDSPVVYTKYCYRHSTWASNVFLLVPRKAVTSAPDIDVFQSPPNLEKRDARLSKSLFAGRVNLWMGFEHCPCLIVSSGEVALLQTRSSDFILRPTVQFTESVFCVNEPHIRRRAEG